MSGSSFKQFGIYRILLFLLAAYGILNTFFGETSDIFGGYGSDGFFYGEYAADFNNYLVTGNLTYEVYSRSLPLFIIHNALIFVHGEIKPEHVYHIPPFDFRYSEAVVAGFKVYNLIIYLLSLFVVHKIARLQRMSAYSAVVFLIIVFINFSQLKQWFFEPVMIDPSYMLHGLLLIYFSLSKNLSALAVTTIIGFAVNELNTYAGIMLCATPFEMTRNRNGSPHKSVAFIVALIAAVLAVYLSYYPMCSHSNDNKTISSVFPVSVAAMSGFIFISYLFLLAEIDMPSMIRKIFRETNWKLLTALVVLIAGYRIFSFVYSDDHIHPICDEVRQTPITYLLNSIRLGSSRPLGFLVAHFIYFGAGVVLIGLHYRKVLEWLKNQGAGVFLTAGILLILLVNSESRHLAFIYLLFATALCSACSFSRNQALIILGLNILLSKAWLPLNPLVTDLYIEAIINNHDLLFREPLQKYMMNLGPWMNNTNYIIWLIIGLFSAGFLYAVLNNKYFAR